MTYRELLKKLQGLTEKQLDMEVIRFDLTDGMYFRLTGFSITESDEFSVNDVVDLIVKSNQPYLKGHGCNSLTV